MTSVIVFDLGRVLVDFDTNRSVSALAAILGIDTGAAAERLRAVEVPFETGRIDQRRAIEMLLETPDRPGWTESVTARERAERLLVAAIGSRFSPMPRTIELVYELAHTGHRLALASNTSPLDFEAVRTLYPDVIAPFDDRLFLSYRIGAMKPDQSFYAAVVKSLDVAADECIFIDDMPQNVVGARNAGMRAIRFGGADALRLELDAMLGTGR
jgi:HAD superfamily hydrolase (TIGR01509 family)